MNQILQYSLLKYRHSLLLNEVINVGLVFLDVPSSTVRFLYPKKLQRISALYNNIDILNIRHHLILFEKKAIHLTNIWKKEFRFSEKNNLKQLLNEEFLIEDSSALFFDDIKSGISLGLENTDSYYKEIFDCYDLPAEFIRKDEKYIENNFKKIYRQKAKQNFRSNINQLTLTNGIISESFRLGWKNGTENIILPLSFDLQEPSSIQHKSILWSSTLNYLKEPAAEQNIRFDLLVIEPASKKLFKAFDNAQTLLNEISANKKIWGESEIEKYTDEVIEYTNK